MTTHRNTASEAETLLRQLLRVIHGRHCPITRKLGLAVSTILAEEAVKVLQEKVASYEYTLQVISRELFNRARRSNKKGAAGETAPET